MLDYISLSWWKFYFYLLNFVLSNEVSMYYNLIVFHHVYATCTQWGNSNCISACSQHVIDDSDACETCSRRRSREAKRAIPRVNALPSRAVPERVQVSQGPCVTLHPCPYPTIRGNEANAFRGPTTRKRITPPSRGTYRGNIGKSASAPPPPRLEWPLFVSGATIRVRRSEQRFLTNTACEWDPTKACGGDKEDRKRENGTAG